MTSPYGPPQVAPQNAPPSAEYTVGVQPGTSGIIYANVVIVSGAGGSGIFVYSPTPGPGNLIGSWAGMAGTDQYGNAYPEGLNVTVGAISGSTIEGSTISGSQIIVSGGGGELLVYDGTPGPGTLIVALSPSNGADEYANVFFPGITILNVNNSEIAFASGLSSETAPGKIQVNTANIGNGGAALNLNSSQISGTPEIGGITIATTDLSSNQGTGVYLGSSAGDIGALGAACFYTGTEFSALGRQTAVASFGIYQQNPNESVFPWADNWHYVGSSGQISFGTGWTNRGSPWAELAYRLTASPPNCVQVRGWVTKSTGTATTLCTLGTPYQPASEQSFVSINGTAQSITQWNISTAGVIGLSFPSAAVAGDNYWIETIFSLDI